MKKSSVVTRYFSPEINKNYDYVFEHVYDRVFNVKQSGIPNRVISHWIKEKLLIDNPEKREWRKFSFIEYCWIKMVQEMRKFNVPLEIIRKVKDELATPIDTKTFVSTLDKKQLFEFAELLPAKEKDDFITVMKNPEVMQQAITEMNYNGMYILVVHSIVTRTHVSVLVNADGQIMTLIENFLDEYMKDKEFLEFYHRSFVSISITEIIKDIIKDLYNQMAKGDDLLLSPLEIELITKEESKVLEIIREKKYKSIYIRFNEKKDIHRIEATEEKKVNPSARFIDYIYSGEYQDIVIKTKDKNIIYFENTKKIKI